MVVDVGVGGWVDVLVCCGIEYVVVVVVVEVEIVGDEVVVVDVDGVVFVVNGYGGEYCGVGVDF